MARRSKVTFTVPKVQTTPKQEIVEETIKLCPISKAGYEKMLKKLDELKKKRADLRSELNDLRLCGSTEDSVEATQQTEDKISSLDGKIDEINADKACVMFIEELGFLDENFVGIGRVVTLENPDGEHYNLTILGTYESNDEKLIVSDETSLAISLIGKKIGDTILFDGTVARITAIKLWQPEPSPEPTPT